MYTKENKLKKIGLFLGYMALCSLTIGCVHLIELDEDALEESHATPEDKEITQLCCTLLNVQQGASEKEIKKAYRQLSMKYHPDKNPGDPKAEEIFKILSEAKSIVLKDEKYPLPDPKVQGDVEKLTKRLREAIEKIKNMG